MGSMLIYYAAIKLMFFYSLVRAQVKSEALQKHYIFLAFIYTLAVAFLSAMLVFSWLDGNWAPWQIVVAQKLRISPWLSWLLQTFVISAIYFKLIYRFDEGMIFVILIILGLGVVYF